MVGYSAMLDYERYENRGLLNAAAQIGLFAHMLAYGTYYTAGAPGAATVSVAV